LSVQPAMGCAFTARDVAVIDTQKQMIRMCILVYISSDHSF
jgi:hypothetical protein